MVPLLLATLLACGGGEPPVVPEAPEAPEPVAGEVILEEPSSGITAMGGEGAVPVELRFTGVSDLHRGFFTEPETVGPLGAQLATCVVGTAQVLVSYDDTERVGRIALKVSPGGLRCMPEASGDAWSLAGLESVGVALAGYRDRVAERFDFRIASFRIGVRFLRGAKQCSVWAAGQHPPDGRRWSPCMDFAGVSRCGAGDGREGVTALRFEGSDASYAAACFGP